MVNIKLILLLCSAILSLTLVILFRSNNQILLSSYSLELPMMMSLWEMSYILLLPLVHNDDYMLLFLILCVLIALIPYMFYILEVHNITNLFLFISALIVLKCYNYEVLLIIYLGWITYCIFVVSYTYKIV